MNLNDYLLIASLITNIALIVGFVIFGPRKPRSSKEVEKSMLDISKALNYKLMIVNLDDTNDYTQNIDLFVFCKPNKVETIYKMFSKDNKIPAPETREGGLQ